MKNIINLLVDKLVKYPLFTLEKPLFKTIDNRVEEFNNKIINGIYKFNKVNCLCGNKSNENDIVISKVDKFNIPVDFLLCKKCGLIRVDKILDEVSLENFYKNEYRYIYSNRNKFDINEFKKLIKPGSRSWRYFEFLRKNLDLNTINNVYEYGCGGGWNLYHFYQLGKNVMGCDFNQNEINFANSIGLEDLYVGTLDERVKDESVDLFILSHVMEHFPNPIQEMIRVIRKVRKGGYIFIEVPGIFSRAKNTCVANTFQNVHVYLFYKDFLEVFYHKLGLRVIYIDENSTALLQKPDNWIEKKIDNVYDDSLTKKYFDISIFLKKCYLVKTLPLIIRNRIKFYIKGLIW